MSFVKDFFKKHNLGIRAKMLLLFSSVIIFSISLMLYFVVQTYGNKLKMDNITQSRQVIANLQRNLESYMDQMENISSTVIYNHYIQNYLINQNRKNVKPKTEYEAYEYTSSQNFQMSVEILSNIIATRQDISSILIFVGKQLSMFKSSNTDIDTAFNYHEQKWFSKALEAEGISVVTGPHKQEYIKHNADTVFSISRTIQSYDGLAYQGVMLIDTNLSIINNYCNSAKLSNNGFVFVIDGSGNTVYVPPSMSQSKEKTHNEKLIKNISSYFAKSDEGSFNTAIDNEDYQIAYSHMAKTDWYIAAVTPYRAMMADADRIKNLIILTGVIGLLLILVLTYFISARITRPIITLKNYMDQADHGNLDIRAPINTKDEVGMLANSFNHMLERITGLMKQLVKEQEQKRKSELKALQHQINPHFLYNTLDSIIWMAESKDENIVPMTEALSKLFRISLSRGQELITLHDELEHVRNYMFIQSMRYFNKFEYTISCDESLMNMKILKLILQPLVENSIYHGIKNKMGKGNISIKAQKLEDRLLIILSDDGIGMDQETCESILKGSPSSKSTKGSGIGVTNVHERIRLYFGEEYGISFESTPGMGTTAYVSLPLITEA